MIKDIRIKGIWIKRELIIIIFTYVLANLLNLASILMYGTEWSELFTSQLYVLYLTEWIYILGVVIRLIYFGIKYLIKK